MVATLADPVAPDATATPPARTPRWPRFALAALLAGTAVLYLSGSQ
jgi:hypothetical protein